MRGLLLRFSEVLHCDSHMAPVDELDLPIGICEIPVIDFRGLCQDEIRTIAHLSGDSPRINEKVFFAINKSCFNESSASRRQTYAKHKITRRVVDSLNCAVRPKAGLAGVPLTSSKDTFFVARTKKCFALADPKEKLCPTENQELIARICQQMQRVANVHSFSSEQILHMETNSLLPSLEKRHACSVTRDLAEQATSTESVLDIESRATRIESKMRHKKGNGSIRVRSTDGTSDDKEKASRVKGLQLQLSVQNTGNLKTEGLDVVRDLKKVEVNGHDNGKSSYCVDGTTRDFITDTRSSELSGRHEEAKALTEGILHRPSKKMRTKEGGRRKSTMGEKSARSNAHLFKKDTDKVEIIGAEKFSGGQKGSVSWRKEGDNNSTKFNYVSPNGQDCSSQKEAFAQMGSSHSEKISSVKGLSEELPVASHTTGQNGAETRSHESLENGNFKFKLQVDENGNCGKNQSPLCIMCGKHFANQYNLRRHLQKTVHKMGKNCDAYDQLDGDSLKARGGVAGTLSCIKGLDICENSDLSRCMEHKSWAFQPDRDVEVKGNANSTASINIEVAKFECDKCHKVFDTERKRLGHLRVHSSRYSCRSKSSRFECRHCLKVFDRHRCYIGHLSVHTRRLKNHLSKLSTIHETGRNAHASNVATEITSPEQKASEQAVKFSCGTEEVSRSAIAAEVTFSVGGIFPCDKCDMFFGKEIDFLGHQMVHLRKLKRKRGIRVPKKLSGSSTNGNCQRKDDANPSTLGCGPHGKVVDEPTRLTGYLCAQSGVEPKTYDGPTGDKCNSTCLGNETCHSPAFEISNGNCQREDDMNTSTLGCGPDGKVVDESTRLTGYLCAQPGVEQTFCDGPAGENATEDKFSSTRFGNETCHTSAFEIVFNKRDEINSSVFWRLLTNSAQSRVNKVSWDSNTFGLTKSEQLQVKDGEDYSLLPLQHVIFAFTPGVLRKATGSIQGKNGLKRERKPWLPLIQGMALFGWSLNGCFVCRHVGCDGAQLIVCNWCEKEFHFSCLMQKFIAISGGWPCPFCKITLKIPH